MAIIPARLLRCLGFGLALATAALHPAPADCRSAAAMQRAAATGLAIPPADAVAVVGPGWG